MHSREKASPAAAVSSAPRGCRHETPAGARRYRGRVSPLGVALGLVGALLAACAKTAGPESAPALPPRGQDVAGLSAPAEWCYVAHYRPSVAGEELRWEECVWDETAGLQYREFAGGTILARQERPVQAAGPALKNLRQQAERCPPFLVERGAHPPHVDAAVPAYLMFVSGDGRRFRQHAGPLADWPEPFRAALLQVLSEAKRPSALLPGRPAALVRAVPVLRSARVETAAASADPPDAGLAPWQAAIARPYRLLPAPDGMPPPAAFPVFIEYRGIPYQIHFVPATQRAP